MAAKITIVGRGKPAPAKSDDTGGKISKAQAQYGPGNGARHCGICQYFRTRPPGPKGSTCTKVAGNISAYGTSNEFLARINPFRKGNNGNPRRGRGRGVIGG